MVAEVLCLYVIAALTVCADLLVPCDLISQQSNLGPHKWLQM